MMKKTIILLSTAAMISVALISGCKKDETDSTGPAIYLNGSNPMKISLNTATSDPGATASDETDGSTAVTSDWSSTNPDVNKKGTYTITYTATDKAGNHSSLTRTVNVVNDVDFLAGSYPNAADSCASTMTSTPFSPAPTVTPSTTTNRKFTITNFGAFGSSVSITCMMETDSTITATSGQSLGGSATLTNVISPSQVVSASGPVFKVTYSWNDGTNSDVCVSTYRK